MDVKSVSIKVSHFGKLRLCKREQTFLITDRTSNLIAVRRAYDNRTLEVNLEKYLNITQVEILEYKETKYTLFEHIVNTIKESVK